MFLEFSLRSACQAHGHEFVQYVALRHPLHMLRGLVAYWATAHMDPREERWAFRGSADAFLQRAAADGDRLLVATGFCQKPLRTAGSVGDCLAGRFNHDCLYLSRLELDFGEHAEGHPACADCSIQVLGRAALWAGASFAVLTSPCIHILAGKLKPSNPGRRTAHPPAG